MSNKIFKEYMENENNINLNYKKVISKLNTKKHFFNTIVAVALITILGISSTQIYAKRQWNIEFEEFKNKEYELSSIGIKESDENGFTEKIDMEYIYQENIGIKLDSLFITDDHFETKVNIVFPKNIAVNSHHFGFGYAIYDEENNIYDISERLVYNYDENNPYGDKKYSKFLYKELGIKYKKNDIRGILLNNGTRLAPINATEGNIIYKIELDSIKGFPKSKKIYMRIYDIGYSISETTTDENGKFLLLDSEDFSLSNDKEWRFEIDVPERMYNRKTILAKLKNDITGLNLDKILITENKLLIIGSLDENNMQKLISTISNKKDLISNPIISQIYISDINKNNYYIDSGISTLSVSHNGFELPFNINKNMLENNTFFLNIDIDGKLYTEELIIK